MQQVRFWDIGYAFKKEVSAIRPKGTMTIYKDFDGKILGYDIEA